MRKVVPSILFFLLGLFIPSASLAQTVSLRGVVVDSVARTGIPSASITLQRIDEPIPPIRTAAVLSGAFRLSSVPRGQYRLLVTHIAYDTLFVTLRVFDAPIDLGSLRMKEKAIPQKAVVIMGTPPPVEQIGDTTQFYAGAFAVNKDANAEDLITKMPGVTVEGTTVKSQGEDIKRVLVDGKQFFSDDPMIALRNLPAEIIERVQVYDKMSDQAELTGFDDGQSVRTMNLITRMDRRNGTFGKAFAGYGSDSRYAGGVSAHRFNSEQRLSVFGLSNSTNQQNFTMQDILGVMGNTTRGRGGFGGGGGRGGGGGGRPGGGGGERGGGMMPDGAMMQRMGGAMNDFMVGEQNGLNTTHSIGATFRDGWSNGIDINGNYFINRSRNQSAQTLEREYITTSDTVQTYGESNSADSRNTNHRFQFRMQWELDSSNSLIISPRITAQLHDASNITLGESGFNTGLVLNTSDVRNTSATTGYNGSVDLTYRHRSDLPGRTVSLQANLGGSDRDGETTLDALSQYPGSIVAGETLRQVGSSRSKSLNYGSSLVYTEPLDVGHLLQWNYRFSRSASNASKVTTAFDTLTGTYSTIMSKLSSDLDNTNTRHSVGTGYRYNASGISGTLSLDYQYSRLAADLRLPRQSVVDKTYWSFLPSAMINLRFEGMTSIQFQYRTSTNTPSVNQLQTSIDNTNPTQLSTGNPELKQTYAHSITSRFGMPNPELRTSFFVTLSYSSSRNAIATSVIFAARDTVLPGGIELKQGTQISRPVNVDGSRNVRGFVMYGFPVSFLGCQMNLNSGLTVGRSPGMINGRMNESRSTAYSQGLSLVSTFSSDVDMSLSYTGNYTSTKNTILSSYDNTYYTHTAGLRSTLTLWDVLVLRTDATNRYYNGLQKDFTQSYVMWNASLGMKLFANNQGELSVSVYDILKQNTNVSIATTELYTETQRTNALGQFVLLTFTYTVRAF